MKKVILIPVMFIFCYLGLHLYDSAPGGVNPESLGAMLLLIMAGSIAVYIRVAGGFSGPSGQIGRFIIGVVSLITTAIGVGLLYDMWNAGAANIEYGLPRFGNEAVGYLLLTIAGIYGVAVVLIKEKKSSPPAGQ